jgi:multimeric flavodoxin WrbA
MTSTEPARHVLGLASGSPGGNAEILLVAALRAAEATGAAVELVRLNELALDEDDLDWLWEHLVECDGLIVSASIVSRTVGAQVKVLVDRLLGPNADAAIIEQLVALREAGQEPVVPFRVDERVLKRRVAGFIAVGGALTPQWWTLALPLLHSTTFSMHTTVADQMLVGGAGTRRSIVLDDAALERAELLGRNVASQLGRAAADAEYLGDPGLCPMCHLDVVVLRPPSVECATCGARGMLQPDLSVRWTDLTTSVISMDEKRAHAREIQETAARHEKLRDEIERRASAFDGFEHLVAPGRTPSSGPVEPPASASVGAAATESSAG